MSIDEAWADAEAALPEWWHIRSLILIDPYKKPTWEVVAAEASHGARHLERGRGPSVEDALHDLAAKLAVRA